MRFMTVLFGTIFVAVAVGIICLLSYMNRFGH